MEYLSPVQHLLDKSASHPDRPYLHQPINRQWRVFTWAEVEDQARRIAAGLKEQGYEPGSRIGIFSKNCAEWFIADLAIMMANMISVPIYYTAGKSTIEYVIQHSQMKAVFVGKLDSTDAGESAIPAEILRITFPYPTLNANDHWDEWLKRYTPLNAIHMPAIDDVMTIVYTSGSTGVPKGVVSTFKNLASAAAHTADRLGGKSTDRSISYLPLAHVTERSLIEGVSFYLGNEVFFVESLDTFLDDLNYARPESFLSVPRLWTKFQSQILTKIPDQKLQALLKIPLVGTLVARKIRKALGLQNARVFGSGTAPISPSILHWFHRLGIHVSEGWGMTETSGLSCGNLPYDKALVGSIGKPVDCVEMKLSDEGEILIRGDAVFKEYYLNEKATEESFVDGWFRTGDCGQVDAQGAYSIVGRIKEQFKTGKGKYVAPVPIESLLSADHNIEQVCVMGSGRKQPIAIIVLAELVKDKSEGVRNGLEATLKEVNAQLEGHQCLDNIIVSSEPWTVENDLLTPTLKIKRNLLEKRFNSFLTTALPTAVIWEDEISSK